MMMVVAEYGFVGDLTNIDFFSSSPEVYFINWGLLAFLVKYNPMIQASLMSFLCILEVIILFGMCSCKGMDT